MRIVQLVPRLDQGGVERGVVEFNKKLVERGFESFVISCGGKLAQEIVKDGGVFIKSDVCSKNLFNSFFRVMALKRIFKKINPHIIHPRSRVPAWLSYFAKGKTAFITTVHGFYSVNRYSRIMTKGDLVICVSNEIKKYVLENYDIAKEKLRVVFRGVDLEKFNLEKLNKEFILRFKKENLLQMRLIVTSIGRITPLKDFETFIKAIALIKKSKPVAGIIVGKREKEEYFKKLQALVEKLGLKKDIFFFDSVYSLPELYYLSDVVVSSSKKPESFGRSIVEAMAMNTPVVASNHGGALDIIKKGYGELFEIGNSKELASKILSVEKNSNLRDYVKKNFSLDKMADGIIRVYKEVL